MWVSVAGWLHAGWMGLGRLSSAGSSSLPAASLLTGWVPDPSMNPAPDGWRGPNVPGLWAERNLFCESELFESSKNSVAKWRVYYCCQALKQPTGHVHPASRRAPGSGPVAGRAAEAAGLASRHLATDVRAQ